MRIVDPAAPAVTGGGTRTLTSRLVALRPSLPDLIDGGFLIALAMVALLGFASTFDSPRYLLVGLVGVVLGVVASHLANVLRWHWLTVVVLAAVTYLLLGGALALQEDVIAGFIPSVAAVTRLSELTVVGWKELLTALPPVAGDGPYVALPYLLSVLAGTVGFAVARRARRVWTALVMPAALLAVVILLGTLRPAAPVVVGLGFAALAFGWLAVRWNRRRRLVGTGAANLTRLLTGVALLVVAMAGAFGIEAVAPLTGSTTRFVLRSYVEPPVDLTAYTSPLVGFRKFSGQKLRKPMSYYNQELLRVESGAQLQYLRLAVLDDYSGQTWTATGGDGGPDTGFQRVGSEVPVPPVGDPVDTRIAVLRAYADNRDLSAWLPSFGQALSVRFEGERARDHAASFRYNLSTAQGLVPDRMTQGDVILARVVPLDVVGAAEETSGGTPVVRESSYEFLNSAIPKLTAGKGSAWEQLRAAMTKLRTDGYYSDGTEPGEGQYKPGHGQFRLKTFVSGDMIVGSDEQYAATLALVATELGFPSRVVFGAVVPDGGVVRGKDVRAWVEIKVGDGSWKTIPPGQFVPTEPPLKTPPPLSQDAAAPVVPPPNPVRPPGTFDSMFEIDSRLLQTRNPLFDQILRIALLVLRWVGPPLLVLAAFVGLILGLKGRRRHRRRTRGAPTTRIAGGWDEVLDQARDLGQAVPAEATRREQTLALGRAEVIPLAAEADRLVFGEGDPDPSDAERFWGRVAEVRRELTTSLGFWRRWRVRLSLRSLLPKNALVQSAARRVAAPVRLAVSHLRPKPARQAG